MSACKVSLENVLLDVRELGKGMDLIRRECSLHDHSVLKGFVQASDSQLDKLQKDAKMAEVSDSVFTSKTSNYPLEQMIMKPFSFIHLTDIWCAATNSTVFTNILFPNSRKPLTVWWATLEKVPRRLHPPCSSLCSCASSRHTRWGRQAEATSL